LVENRKERRRRRGRKRKGKKGKRGRKSSKFLASIAGSLLDCSGATEAREVRTKVGHFFMTE